MGSGISPDDKQTLKFLGKVSIEPGGKYSVFMCEYLKSNNPGAKNYYNWKNKKLKYIIHMPVL